MPYLKIENRGYFIPLLEHLNHCAIANGGELNFLFTEIIKQYMQTHSKDYRTCNDIVGALECCKQEFYRRIVGPYENEKIAQNGDVYFPVEVD